MARPRSVSLEPADMISLGEEMLTWLEENKPLHLSAFWSLHKGYLFSEWDTMSKKPEFVPYYEQAMFIVGHQYLDKNSNVREGASQRWQRVYFKDLRKEEDETKAYESSLKQKENKALSEDVREQNDKLHQMILEGRKDRQEALNSALINTSKDT